MCSNPPSSPYLSSFSVGNIAFFSSKYSLLLYNIIINSIILQHTINFESSLHCNIIAVSSMPQLYAGCSTKIIQQSASVLGPDQLGRSTPGCVGHLTVGPVVFHHEVDIDVNQGQVSLHNMMQRVVTSLNSFRKVKDVSSCKIGNFRSGLPRSQETQQSNAVKLIPDAMGPLTKFMDNPLQSPRLKPSVLKRETRLMSMACQSNGSQVVFT